MVTVIVFICVIHNRNEKWYLFFLQEMLIELLSSETTDIVQSPQIQEAMALLESQESKEILSEVVTFKIEANRKECVLYKTREDALGSRPCKFKGSEVAKTASEIAARG